MFLSTEIFSKRRKIYAWLEEKPEWPQLCASVHMCHTNKLICWCVHLHQYLYLKAENRCIAILKSLFLLIRLFANFAWIKFLEKKVEIWINQINNIFCHLDMQQHHLFPLLHIIIFPRRQTNICLIAVHVFLQCLRPYHVECTGSRPITEVKQHRAWLVLGWVTA